jgi:hypothetical protein
MFEIACVLVAAVVIFIVLTDDGDDHMDPWGMA